MSSPGAFAANFHAGSRSELLADYLFSAWGAVTPVRRQDDFGVDLSCTLTERLGQRAVVTDYFVIQVKSTDDPWVFETPESVRWLVDYPQPLFFAWVDKRAGIIRVYHVMPRFYVGVLPPFPPRLELTPGDGDEGSCVQWHEATKFSLGAPILRVVLSDLLDDSRLDQLKQVFAIWVRADRENCDLRRRGLLRFRMPGDYRVNETPSGSIAQLGFHRPTDASCLNRGIVAAAESAECIGSQLARTGDRAAGLFAALFVDHLHRRHAQAFDGLIMWNRRLGDLAMIVCDALNATLEKRMPNNYWYEGIDAIYDSVLADGRVAAFLKRSNEYS